ncbi:MAG: flavodoxin family protein [Deltaproteobacteria bacterium]|nr:flavodoxin family protein [Deltaproteobacteria bacterium]
MTADIISVYGSPRRKGNTALLMKQAVQGARDGGATVEEFVLRDLKISPCLEIYACKKEGECAIKDDFQMLRDKILSARGLMIASPIFFYSVSAHTKIMMDRFQSLWVKKYWIDEVPYNQRNFKRKGLFISVGATQGKKLFDGVCLSMTYFFDTLDMELWRSLIYRGVDHEGEVEDHPDYLKEAYQSGKALAESLRIPVS